MVEPAIGTGITIEAKIEVETAIEEIGIANRFNLCPRQHCIKRFPPWECLKATPQRLGQPPLLQ